MAVRQLLWRVVGCIALHHLALTLTQMAYPQPDSKVGEYSGHTPPGEETVMSSASKHDRATPTTTIPSSPRATTAGILRSNLYRTMLLPSADTAITSTIRTNQRLAWVA